MIDIVLLYLIGWLLVVAILRDIYKLNHWFTRYFIFILWPFSLLGILGGAIFIHMLYRAQSFKQVFGMLLRRLLRENL